MRHCGLFFATLLVLFGAFAACVPGPGRQTEVLLQQNHQAMDDGQLFGHFRQINDQLLWESRARGAGLLGQPVDDQRIDRLRHRWNEVRGELRRREGGEP